MGLTIDGSDLLSRRFLKIKKDCVKFYGASFWGSRRFRFDEIECVLMSPENVLSFQVGREMFSIATKPNKPKHQAAIAALVEGLNRSKSARSPLHYHFPS